MTTQNNQQKRKMPVSDAIISTPVKNQGEKGFIVANIVKAEHRGMTTQNQPYKSDSLSINLNNLHAAIQSGAITVSPSGYVTLNFTYLTPESRAKLEAKLSGQGGGNQQPKQSDWNNQNNGNQGGQGGWGKQNNQGNSGWGNQGGGSKPF